MSSFGAIILCGGESSRMAYPKAFLKIDEITLLEKVTEVYLSAGILNPVIILNHRFFTSPWLETINKLNSKAIVIKNQFPEHGRAHSIGLGLKLMKGKSECFIQNIDSPDFNKELLEKMMKVATEDSFVVPVFKKKGGHPILIGKKIMDHLTGLRSSKWILKDELENFTKTRINAGKNNVLLNLNTDSEWQKYLEKHNSKK